MGAVVSSFFVYIAFLNRPSSNGSITTGVDVLPHLYQNTVLLTLFFSGIFLFTTQIVRNVWSSWYASLGKRKQHELPSYVLCLVHHFVAVPWAWYRVYCDFHLSAEAAASINYAPITAIIAPWCIAYLITDTIFYAIPELLKGKLEYMIHHILVLFLVISSLYGPGSLLRFIPHLLLSDTTNIFFNTAWLLRLSESTKESFLVKFCELLFAVAFLLVRVINMPCMFYALSTQRDAAGLGPARYVLAPIAAMQWYWFYKILSTIGQRMTGTREVKKDADHSGDKSDLRGGSSSLRPEGLKKSQ
jgi:TLC domain